jgi:hypothetical protein
MNQHKTLDDVYHPTKQQGSCPDHILQTGKGNTIPVSLSSENL